MGALREAIPQSFPCWSSITDIGSIVGSRVIPGQYRAKMRRVERKHLFD
jgi:hypothetical protein